MLSHNGYTNGEYFDYFLFDEGWMSFDRGLYSVPGTYIWTIKATGYADTMVTVKAQ